MAHRRVMLPHLMSAPFRAPYVNNISTQSHPRMYRMHEIYCLPYIVTLPPPSPPASLPFFPPIHSFPPLYRFFSLGHFAYKALIFTSQLT